MNCALTLLMLGAFTASLPDATAVESETFARSTNLQIADGRERIPVSVRVVGPTGAGVEGITLVNIEPGKDIELCTKQITDAAGFAEFMALLYEESRFMVMCAGSVLSDDGVSCRPAGPRDTNSTPTIQLSHERLGGIFILNGREVVVRVYGNWDLINQRYRNWLMPCRWPKPFETVTLRLKGGMLVFDLPQELLDAPEKTLVAVVGADQTDNAVRALLADAVYARPYKPALRFDLSSSEDLFDGSRIAFIDALGNPMAGAAVEIYISDYRNPTSILVKQTVLNNKARLKLPRATTIPPAEFTLILSHSDYGRAIIHHIAAGCERQVIVPLVKVGSDDSTRSIWGRVVDANGNPVAGATLCSTFAVTAGRGRLDSSADLDTSILTDEQGRFRMNLPLDLSRTDLVELPASCRYNVTVRPSPESDFLPYSGTVPAGRETTVVLDRIDAPYRTFAFEDAHGPITDANVLEQICICIERNERLTYHALYHDIKDGRKLPLGKYKVDPYGVDIPEFEPIEVTADTPQHLVFRTKSIKEALYTGRVVDGTTGRPIAGAFVAIGERPKQDFSLLSARQWQQLQRLAPASDCNAPGAASLKNIINFRRLLRTDSLGLFQFPLFLRENQYTNLVAFARGFTAMEYDLSGNDWNKNRNNHMDLPDAPLYPAATVLFEPNVPQPGCEVRTRLLYPKDGQPQWFAPFRNTWPWRLFLPDQLQPNRLYSMQVPAGLKLQLRLQVDTHVVNGPPYWPATVTQTLSAQPGHVIDLGPIRMHKPIPVFVQVLDSAGEPVAGVAVSHRGADGGLSGLEEITDEEGFARLQVLPYCQGSFLVGYRQNQTNKLVSESIDYQTSGPGDANNVYTLQISDRMIQNLFSQTTEQ